METDRPHVLREAIQACRKGGTVSIPDVYGGLIDKVPLGAAFGKGLTLKMGQTHVPRHMQPLLVTQDELIETSTHLAFYAGWPHAMTAMCVVKEVFQNNWRATEGAQGDPQ